jgi:predicted Zn-dependent protease
MDGQYRLIKQGNEFAAISFAGMKQKYLIDSKNMEYAADVEGAKLAVHAGYNLDCGSEVMSYFSSLPTIREWLSDHPNPERRLINIKDNAKYFPNEWADIGKANIYNSEPMPVRLSSDRKSMVISAPVEKLNPNQYYSPETMEELYARFGYMYYVNGEFNKSLQYFGELFKIDQTNAAAYLYASYAGEYMYKLSNSDKYMKLAKEYAKKAYSLDSKNKYIKEQVDAL